jgi:CDP-diacylglycerol--glycerol-3-phosphate 3-phosphatidyltransferase
MTLATKLTLLRVFCIPFFIIAFIWEGNNLELNQDWGKIIATAIFIIAAITDYYDGYLARRYQQVTTLGRFMDPIADKLLVSTALILMVEYKAITFVPGYVAVIIIAREFAVTGLRLICAEKGKVIDASNAGKLKTTTQLTAIITTLCLICLRILFKTYSLDEYSVILMKIYSPAIQILMLIASISTIYSGYDYFKKNWNHLDEQLQK